MWCKRRCGTPHKLPASTTSHHATKSKASSTRRTKQTCSSRVLNWKHPVHGYIFYKNIEGTFLGLAIDTAVLASPVKMEAAAPTESNPNPVAFPHIFGPLTPASCVTRQMEVLRGADGTFLSIEGI